MGVGFDTHAPPTQYPSQHSAVLLHPVILHAHALFTHFPPQQSASPAQYAPMLHGSGTGGVMLASGGVTFMMPSGSPRAAGPSWARQLTSPGLHLHLPLFASQ